MKTWNEQSSIPAAAITYAGGRGNNQPVIFTTQYDTKGYYNGETDLHEHEMKWTIKSVNVTLTRDWNTSQALITLICNLPDITSEIPPLPDVSVIRGGTFPYLSPEDEIRIYAGYVESTSVCITPELLDEIPFSYTDLDDLERKHNPDKPLAPIFWGFIDKIDFSGNSKGFQVLISCRDRTRIFADTRILSIPDFGGDVKDTIGDNAALDAIGFSKGDRHSILLSIARGAAGSVLGENTKTKDGEECPSCWKPINPGERPVRGFSFAEDGKTPVHKYPQESPSGWVLESSLGLYADDANPRFHIWSERPPIKKGEANATLQIVNKTPMEIINYLAKTEERPMDFFASHVNGDFVFGPRSIDFSGSVDPDRFYRTYFFKSYPKEKLSCPPLENQMILSIRAVTSTLATFNNFIVVDSSTKGGNGGLLNQVRQGVYALPAQLEGRDPSPPCRTNVIYDGAIATYPNKEFGTLILSLAAARILARDVNGVQIELLGDPTLYPGEAIRIYNTVIHDNNTVVTVSETNIEKRNEEIIEKAKEVAKKTENLSKPDKLNRCKNKDASNLVQETFEGTPGSGRATTDFSKLILPVYKVRTIQHKLSATGKRGFTSTVAAVADY